MDLLIKTRNKRSFLSVRAEPLPAISGGDDQKQSRTFWVNKHPESLRFGLIRSSLPPGGEPRDLLNVKMDSYSFLFINVTAAVIHKGDLHCRLFMLCNVDC